MTHLAIINGIAMQYRPNHEGTTLSVAGLMWSDVVSLTQTTPSVELPVHPIHWALTQRDVQTILAGLQVYNNMRGWIHNPTGLSGTMELKQCPHTHDFYIYLKSANAVEYFIHWNGVGSHAFDYTYAVAILYNRESVRLFEDHQSIINS